MRFKQEEKMEIIEIVQDSELGVKSGKNAETDHSFSL